MKYEDNQYIVPESLYWKGVLHNFSKSRTALQPIFEAFTNALEAIKILQKTEPSYKGEISIRINSAETTVPDSYNFAGLSISDNGIGFDDDQFKRFNTFRDITKGFKNLGSGRIQYVHYFDNIIVKSVFCQEGKFYEREFSASKKKAFLDKNSIIYHKYCKETNETASKTTISFNGLLENSGIYNKLDQTELKEQLKKRYIHYFCHNRTSIPKIDIQFYIQGELKGETSIIESDFPGIDKTEPLELQYSKISSNGKSVEKLDKVKEFKIDSFRIPRNLIDNNDLKLVSKGEIVEESEIKLESIPKGEHVNGFRYIFLVSSEYIDDRDSDMRGVLNIPSIDNFTKNRNLFTEEEILLEEIQEGVNNKINTMYPEIEEVQQEHLEQLEQLKEMFLIDDETAGSINISINDSESKILEKFYEAEAKKTALLDASIKDSIDQLNKLDTTSPNYLQELKKEVDKLVKAIPLQNKKSLTHYVARRKLVLDLLAKVLDKKLEVQQSGREINEALIHDLLFQQGESNPENSDLWIINEDFIYFKGSSNIVLSQVEIEGDKLFKEDFTTEEEKYLRSLGENRKIKKPDVLLFPEEGKCIILEFKAPDVNVSDHLTQIDKYAGLIRNYTADNFQITTFFGYLLGESIEPRDVLGAVSSYEESYQFDYLFRPSTKVIGFDGRNNGAIYTEVIKYSTLLERAKQRNKIFIEKLQ
ncbi:ATP-binding protein [Cytophagaceae bacterium 50C-KIRBA]|uniref:ATP-binding protein n=1 Tax=Aquirufa beregesia TaxID=2516556 RepID=A0ABX0EUX8_9BACT|nr:ATP-binding protein [Aquirufa beregesia]NGZ43377.1 ATP-binding protein [Aquirufa beregesia]